ncbi:MAG: NADH-quinone oxidoreductase subunit M [Alphaproteobacteria bacterium]|nr:NADH-quinone oxidoreductase subunit M [Alphaproteobacteria bacterium]
MGNFYLLSLTTFLPLVGALLIFLVRSDEAVMARNVRWVALWTSVVTLVLSLFVWGAFDSSKDGFQLVEELIWIPSLGVAYRMGVDGISLFFVLLSTLLTPVAILASWTTITTRVKEFMIAFLVLETMMIGTFCALDTVLFYIFFESVLIPMFLIIGVWGGARRVYSAFKFFLYTLAGSVLMLVALLVIWHETGTTDITAILAQEVPTIATALQPWLWFALLASFAVKLPMWPLHTWLPDAHVEAPTAGSVILAGVLLKMGGYGFLRFSLPILPVASHDFAPFIFVLSVIAIIYTSLVALAQEDMKKLIAYSSVAHMGFVTLGIFAATHQGVAGAIFQMLSHGIVSAALFLCVGVVYDRMHTREIVRYGGLVHRMPRYALVFMVFTLASIGLPGTSGFIGEFLVLIGVFEVSSWFAFLAATGIILGAAYMLFLYRRVMFGELVREDLKDILDLNWREVTIFAPLVAIVLWMGLFPQSFLGPMEASVEHLVVNYNAAVEASGRTLAAR